MNKLLIIFLTVECLIWPDLSFGDENNEIQQVMYAYEQAWSKHDANAVSAFYFEPAMRVSKGGPTVRPTLNDQKLLFTGLLQGLVDRGYERSDWEHMDVHLLDAQTAIVSGITARYKTDGSLMERLGVTYLLWKTPDGWKIFMSATQSPDRALKFQ